MPASTQELYSFIHKCSQSKDLEGARLAHSLILAHGLRSSALLCDRLLSLFGACGALLEANLVFSTSPSPTRCTWHAIISTQFSCGKHHAVLAMFHRMRFEYPEPDASIYGCVLEACGRVKALVQGMLVHVDTIRLGLQEEAALLPIFFDMYNKCGSFEDAYDIFKRLPSKSIDLQGAIISHQVEYEHETSALDLFKRMLEEGLSPDRFCFARILRACSSPKAIREGFQMHSLIVIACLECDKMLGSTLIFMYTKCGSMEDAHAVFDVLPNRDRVSWGLLMTGYFHNGNFLLTLHIFKRMNEEGLSPDKWACLCAVKACTLINALKDGMQMYDLIVKSHFDTDGAVANSVIDMFAKSGCLRESQRVIELGRERSIVAWNAIIAGHVQHGNAIHAVDCVQNMQQMGCQPDRATYVCLLRAFSLLGLVEEEYLVHNSFIQSGLVSDTRLANTLIDVYLKFGRLDDAYKVFHDMPSRDAVSWSVMVAGYMQHEEYHKVFEIFDRINHEDIKVDPPMFVCMLKACTNSLSLIQGRVVHELLMEKSFDACTIVANALLDMYAKCGSLREATAVFDRLAWRDTITWSAMISAFCHHGYASQAITLFDTMQKQGFHGDKITLTSILKASAMTEDIFQGMIVHDEVVKLGVHTDKVIGNALIDFYMKCACLSEACKIFDSLPSQDTVTWGAIIAGYVQHEQFELALCVFEKMRKIGMPADEVIFCCTLKACTGLDFRLEGMLVHDLSIRSGHATHFLIGNALIDMYSKLGFLEEARKIFDGTSQRDSVTWNAMISGYVQHNQGFLAIELFDQMHEQSKKRDSVTYTCALKACGCVVAIKRGRAIHDHVIRTGDIQELTVSTTLVDMYANFGLLDEACKSFEKLSTRTVVSWNAMIAGYAQLGSLKQALECLQSMRKEGLKPDSWSYTIILSACSHEGLVEEGSFYFEMMKGDKLPMLSKEHFHCMIELLSSAGQLHEAEKLLQSTPIAPDMTGWMIMLGACKTFGDFGLGRECFEEAHELDSRLAASYVLMSKICSDMFKWEDYSHLQVLRKDMQAWKKPAQACIEVNNRVHEFVVGEKGHLEDIFMYNKLSSLKKLMISDGLVPQVDFG